MIVGGKIKNAITDLTYLYIFISKHLTALYFRALVRKFCTLSICFAFEVVLNQVVCECFAFL